MIVRSRHLFLVGLSAARQPRTPPTLRMTLATLPDLSKIYQRLLVLVVGSSCAPVVVRVVPSGAEVGAGAFAGADVVEELSRSPAGQPTGTFPKR
jgi:hypothetical protein